MHAATPQNLTSFIALSADVATPRAGTVLNLLVGKVMWYCLCVSLIIDEKRGLRRDQDLYDFR